MGLRAIRMYCRCIQRRGKNESKADGSDVHFLSFATKTNNGSALTLTLSREERGPAALGLLFRRRGGRLRAAVGEPLEILAV